VNLIGGREMNTQWMSIDDFSRWVRRREHPLAKDLYRGAKAILQVQVPCIRSVHGALYRMHLAARAMVAALARIFYWTPLFKSRITGSAHRLYLYGGMPQVLGSLHMRFGDDCRVSGVTTFSGRSCAATSPQLNVGSNVDIGWQTTIAVGRRVELGDNVRIAGRCFLAGYPGHPLDPVARAQGLPETDEQVGDIVLENDVWLATGVSVMAGVRIGQATVVAAGSVVTRDLPAGVLAGGVPARVIRLLNANEKG